MPKQNLFARFVNYFSFAEPEQSQRIETKLITAEGVTPVNLHVNEVGASGTEIQSGYFYEEYLQELTGRPAADVYDKMRRSDAKIKMAISAVKSPLRKAAWEVQPGDAESEESKKIAEFVEFVLFKDMEKTWSELLAEITSVVEFGHSIFEKTHKAVVAHEKWGNYNGLKSMGFRSQRTIEKWHLDVRTGKLLGLEQWIQGDMQRRVEIPGSALVVFSLDKEGDNYEGISMLRAAYGAWWRKNLYLRLAAAGFERNAIKTPVLKFPQGQQNSEQYNKARAALQVYTSHQNAVFTLPEGYEVEFLDSDFDADKAKTMIEFENTEIVHAFVANFLALGQDGKGSYALSFDLSDFFLSTVEFIGKMICDQFNKNVIKELVDMNFGPQQAYPELTVSGISDKAGKELAEIAQILTSAKILTPEDDLEDNFRKRYGLPPRPEGLERPAPDENNEPEDEEGKGEDGEPEDTLEEEAEEKPKELSESIQLAETPKKLISQGSEELLELMKSHLKTIADNLVKKTVKRWSNGEGERAIKDNTPTGLSEYYSELQGFMAGMADASLAQARKEVPSKKNIKLADIDKLPSKLKRRLKGQATLLADTQVADLEKAIYFQYLSSMDLDSESVIAANLSEAAQKYLDSASIQAAAGNSVAKVVNDSRNAFFDEPEVADEIESWTFVNGDPVSEICSALAGTVFAAEDPDLETYQPPLHHNCKSIMVPNLKGAKNPEVTEKDKAWRKSVAGAQDSITLADIVTGGLAIQSITVKKSLAITESEARKFAAEIVNDPLLVMTTFEDSYRFEIADLGMFMDGTLRTFCPLEGVSVMLGRVKELVMSEGKKNRSRK